jgi:nitrate reductase gamma subunit
MINALVGLIVLCVVIAIFAFWIWMIVDCATKEPSEGNDKLVWIVIILFAQIIGALIYYFVRRPQRFAQLGR